MIRVGCSGWPVGQARYFKEFSTVEIVSTLLNLPQLTTVEKWRKAAPRDFEFSIKCWQLVTHSPSSSSYDKLTGSRSPKSLALCGNFRPTPEVQAAWEGTRAVAKVLGARNIVFETPSSFYPNADHLRDMYKFFKTIRREAGVHYVWEPRGGGWSSKLTKKVCQDLALVHAVDPLSGRAEHGSVYYYHLPGRRGEAQGYSDVQLRHVRGSCEGKRAYLYFGGSSMHYEARRFAALIDPLTAGRR